MSVSLIRLAARGALAGLLALLAGCGSDQSDLRAWMDESRRTMPREIEKIAEPKTFPPFRYASANEIDPFSLIKLKLGLPQARSGMVRPDLARPREVLEAYPLDSMAMVGNLVRGGKTVALVMAEKMLYQARVGHYIGQNFGRITRISEDEITIREIVQDAAGDWVERDSVLKLQVEESGK